jgi:hypothetical protein
MIGYKFYYQSEMLWRNNQGALFLLSPPKNLENFDHRAARKLLIEHNKFLCRWETEFDELSNSAWWHIIKDRAQTIEELPSKTRYMIRKASKTYVSRPIDVSVICEKGYRVYLAAYKRYITHEPILSEIEFLKAVKELPKCTEWWGVFDLDGGDLVGFSENYVESNVCFYVSMWLDPDAMRTFAGYQLLYEMEIHYLRDRGFSYISDGARNLSHNTNIHEFLVAKFNFRKAYAKLNVVYSPFLRILVAVAYPFRSFIGLWNLVIFKKISILLTQEEICRTCDRKSK